MSTTVLGAAGVALAVGTGLATGAAIGLRSWAELALGAYVVAFAELIGLTLVLSLFGAVTRVALGATLVLVFAASLAFWLRVRKPQLPGRRRWAWRPTGADPAVLVLGAVVGLAAAYVVALMVGTPQNNWDSLTYHLTRAALWRQEHGVSYIADAYDQRLNANPPNAELAVTAILELGRSERLTGVVQLGAWIACAAGVAAIARRVGLSRKEALFGALLFVLLPIVLLQASTTQNDLITAALLVAATTFVTGSSRGHLVLAALACGLAAGTKVTAVYALPVLVVAALVAPPTAWRARRLAAITAGFVAGSYWYVVNAVETGRLLGDRPDSGLIAVFEPTRNLLGAFARVLDAFDLSGALHTDRFVLNGPANAGILMYAIVAAVLTAALLIAARRGHVRTRTALAAGALALVPLALPPVSYALWRVFAKLYRVLGSPDEGLPGAAWEAQTSAGEGLSWFGPLGLLLVVGVGIATVVLVRRRELPTLALVLAGAPLAWFVLVSVTLAYDPWQGRFFMYPVALSAALWGLVLRVPSVAWAAVAISTAAASLSLSNSIEKPSGLPVFAEGGWAIWSMERWQVQSIIRAESRPVLEFLDQRVPQDDSIALALGGDDFGYPAFGRFFERRVELVPPGSSAREVTTQWLLANPERTSAIDRECWREAFRSETGAVFRRVETCGP
jgi:hypothetical protein